ncbi:hypothetical protein AUC43_09275 [Hymenobacter sedentarius]|uniref:VOC domain-containing protein n=1 Tax=Hymenobacter sedentarius TaxID=1411621 RepID=A0A0U4BL35_9BACT|nr:hypothetical protein AUC43_09275 [Hymenobacter sedentarius]
MPRCYGQSKPGTAPIFNHAAVCVHDLKASTGFYRTVLELQEIANPFNDGIHAWFSIGPNLQLHVIQRDCTPIVNKNIHLCFSVASLRAFMGHLEKLSVPYTNLKGDSKEPTARIDGVKQIYLQDPDGYWIEINDAK